MLIEEPGSQGGSSLTEMSWEGPLEKGMAIHYSILAWRILWTEEPDGLQSIGLDNTEQLNNTFTEETTYANTRVKS